MVKEKEAFIINVLKTIDSIVIIISFVSAYFFDYLIRTVYDFGGMAYAISPTFDGLLYFSRMNLPLTITFVPIWIMLLTILGFYKEFRITPLSDNIKTIIKAGILSVLVLSSVFFILQMKLTSRLFIGTFTITTTVFLILAKTSIILSS